MILKWHEWLEIRSGCCIHKLKKLIRACTLVRLNMVSFFELKIFDICFQRLYSFFHAQACMKFIMLINVKMPTIVGILTFISMIKTTSESLKARKSIFLAFEFFY